MKKNKIFRIIFMLIIVLTLFFSSIFGIKVNANTNTESLENIWDYSDFLDNDYRNYMNKKIEGKQYKAGLISCYDVIEIGNVSLCASEVERLTDNYAVGLINELETKSSVSYTIVEEVSLSLKTKVGVKNMLKAVATLKNVVNAETGNEYTREYEFLQNIKYSHSLTNNYEISSKYNINQICPNKTTVRVSRVALYVKFHINESYIMHNWWWNWSKDEKSINSDYDAVFYVGDVVTFVYNDNTFGTVDIGQYQLNTCLKIY